MGNRVLTRWRHCVDRATIRLASPRPGAYLRETMSTTLGETRDHLPLRISRQGGRSAVVLSVEGEMDSFAAERFDRLIRRQERAGLRELSIDFSGASFVDAGTVGVLVAAARRAAVNDWRLGVQNARGLVRKVFEITQLQEMIDHWQSSAPSLATEREGTAGRGAIGCG